MKIRLFSLFVLMALAWIAVGCGNKQAINRSTLPAPTAVVNPAKAGTIDGTVRLDGQPPALHPIDMSGEPFCMQANHAPVYPPVVVTGKNGALANVVVYVKAGLGRYRYEQPAAHAELDQNGCMFAPHVLAVMANQPIEIRNDDATVHNIHAMPSINRGWNRSEEPGHPPFQVSFPIPEHAIPIVCNVHPWMRAFVFVFDDPYFAVTTKTGTFALKNLPPGTYTVEAWQEKYGVQDRTVTLSAKESRSISFVFEANSSP